MSNELVATGGGAKSKVWLQIMADVLGTQLRLPVSEEGAAYGAALLALVGVGAFPNVAAALEILPGGGEVIQPTHRPVYEEMARRYQSLYKALKACN